MVEGPKHPDVVRFLVLYRKIRDWTDDDPAHVRQMAQDDSVFKDLCLELSSVESSLRRAEESRRALFAKTVGSDFISAWRDCEARYATALADVFVFDLLGMDLAKFNSATESKAEIDFRSAVLNSREEAHAIESVIDHAEMDITNMPEGYDEGYCDQVEQGITAWRQLTNTFGFNLEGVFRRRKLIPFVLVPSHVSSRYGVSTPISLFTYLEQAHEAFIYGAPLAALSLMRSILEVVLRDHYGSAGDLEKAVDNAKLPNGVRREQLHKLRRLVNKILHVSDNAVSIPRNLEREIISHLFLLRDLIERAPRYR